MEHLRHDLGSLKKGSTVVVTLQNQANVQLMTSSDYSNYKAGRPTVTTAAESPAQEHPASRIAVREDPEEPGDDLLGGQTWDVFISHASEARTPSPARCETP